MVHSLSIDRQIELMGDGQMIDSGAAAGAVIRLGGIGNTEFDLGAGEPQTTVITALLLDGDRPVGRRTGNATINLPIYVIGPGIQSLVAAREMVLQIVDQEVWELVLQLEGLPPTVFDCLRAKVTMPTVITHLQQDVCTFTVQCQRLPFGRSDSQDSITVLAPPGTPGGGGVSVVPTIVFDNFEVPGGTVIISGTTWVYSSSVRFGSSGIQSYVTTGASTYERNPTGTWDLRNYASITFWTAVAGGAVKRSYWITLYDNAGRSWALPRVAVALPGGLQYVKSTVSLRSTTPSTGFDQSLVTKYRFRTDGGIYLDDMEAVGGSVNVTGGSRGGVYNISGVRGSARAPINIDLNRPSGSTITGGILHRPELAPSDWTPLVQVDPTLPTDGNTQLLAATTIERWNSTYTIVLSIAVLGGTADQQRTTTLNLTEFAPGYTETVSVARTYTPREIGLTAQYLYLGRVSLPIRRNPPSGRAWGFHMTLACTGISPFDDRFTDVLFLDTHGETIIWQNNAAATHIYVDEPDPVTVNHGALYAGTDHGQSAEINDKITALSGEPLSLDPDDNSMLVHCWDGAGQLTINYTPRWRGLQPQ